MSGMVCVNIAWVILWIQIFSPHKDFVSSIRRQYSVDGWQQAAVSEWQEGWQCVQVVFGLHECQHMSKEGRARQDMYHTHKWRETWSSSPSLLSAYKWWKGKRRRKELKEKPCPQSFSLDQWPWSGGLAVGGVTVCVVILYVSCSINDRLWATVLRCL